MSVEKYIEELINEIIERDDLKNSNENEIEKIKHQIKESFGKDATITFKQVAINVGDKYLKMKKSKNALKAYSLANYKKGIENLMQTEWAENFPFYFISIVHRYGKKEDLIYVGNKFFESCNASPALLSYSLANYKEGLLEVAIKSIETDSVSKIMERQKEENGKKCLSYLDYLNRYEIAINALYKTDENHIKELVRHFILKNNTNYRNLLHFISYIKTENNENAEDYEDAYYATLEELERYRENEEPEMVINKLTKILLDEIEIYKQKNYSVFDFAESIEKNPRS